MRKATVIIALLGSAAYASAASFNAPGNMESVYREVLNQVKQQGYQVERASPDSGIRTALKVTGHYHQTGSYLNIQFVSEGGETAVDVSVMEEKRYKALQTEPWSTPKKNGQRSASVAQDIQKVLRK